MIDRAPGSHTVGARFSVIAMVILASFFPFVSSATQGYFREPNLRFDRISIDDGLSQGQVRCILQDETGYMWFGTQDGLNRYDGYEFTIFVSRPGDSTSLSGNEVYSLIEDRNGDLWVGTNRGLNRFSTATGSFESFGRERTESGRPGRDGIRALFEDSKGRLWVGTRMGLENFDPATGTFTSHRQELLDLLGGDRCPINAIVEYTDGELLLGGPPGVIGFHPDRGTWRLIEPANDSEGTHRPLLVDGDDVVWAGEYEPIRLDQSSNRFVHGPRMPVASIVNTLMEDGAGRLWIGTQDLGVWVSDPGKSRILRGYPHDFDARRARVGPILSLYKDRSGGVWIGTNGHGLLKWNLCHQKFHLLSCEQDDERGLGSRSIRAIHEDEDGTVWVGGYGALDRIDPITGKTTHIRTPVLSRDNVYSIAEDLRQPERYLWIGTSGTGLNHYDRLTGECIKYRCSREYGTREVLAGSVVHTIVPLASGDLWIGTNLGLSFMSAATNEFIWFPEATGSASNPVWVSCIVGGEEDDLLIGTEGAGLVEFNPKTEASVSYRYDPANTASISSNDVRCIHEDSKGRFWVGTRGGGLNLFDRASGRFRYFTTVDGLPNNVVYGILEDSQGNLWLSTNRGLSRFNPDQETFRNYAASDGLQSNEFNSGAFHLGRSGRMYFGGVEGVTSFMPHEIVDDQVAPGVVISSVEVTTSEGERRTYSRGDLTDRIAPIELSHRDFTIKVSFAGLHYAGPERGRYAYRLEGLGDEWHDVGNARSVTLSGLRSGSYEFTVSAANPDGVWNDEGASVRFDIPPPFWATTWFRAAALVSIAILLAALYRLRTSYSRRRQQELEFLKRFGDKTNESLMLPNVAEATVHGFMELAEPDAVLLFLREGDNLVLERCEPRDTEVAATSMRPHRVGECLCGLAARDGKAVYCFDVINDPRCSLKECKAAGIRSFAALPLSIGGENIGVLGLASLEERDFSDWATMFEAVASKSAASLRNALFYRRAQSHLAELRREVDERKRAEAAVRDRQDMINAIVETSRDVIWAVDLDAVRTYINPAVEQVLGYSPRELIGQSSFDLMHPNNQKAGETLFPRWVETKSGWEREIIRWRHRDGSWRYLESSGVPILDDDGEVKGFRIVDRDITERIMVEKALQIEKERAKHYFDVARVVLVAMDRDQCITMINRAGCELLGYTEAELLGRNWLDLCITEADRDEVESIFRRIIADEGDPLGFPEHLIETKSGEYRLVAWHSIAIRDDENRVIATLSSGEDLTDRRRMQEALIQTEKMMTVGGLAAGMAHEINNPLSGILQGIQNTRRRISSDLSANIEAAQASGVDLESVKNYLKERHVFDLLQGMEDAATRAARIVRNMLQFSKPGSAEHSPADLSELLDRALDLARSDFDLRKRFGFLSISVEREFDRSLRNVPCVPTELEQVVLNIVKNAAEAMSEQGKPVAHRRLIVRTLREDDWARIEIEDNGPGMDRQTCRRVFEPFFTTKDVGSGTGLGLSVSYFIITNNHDGTIEVESSQGIGTKFVIRLPIGVDIHEESKQKVTSEQ